jgi:hypothetical protein
VWLRWCYTKHRFVLRPQLEELLRRVVLAQLQHQS